jgi:hypothetical protein
MPVTFESALYDLAELLGKGGAVEQMVDTKARSRRFSRVCRTNPFLRRPNAIVMLE